MPEIQVCFRVSAHRVFCCAGPDPAKTYDYGCDTGPPEILVPNAQCPKNFWRFHGGVPTPEACAYLTANDELCGNRQYFIWKEDNGACACCNQYSEPDTPPASVQANPLFDIYLTCGSAEPGEALCTRKLA